MKTEFHYLPTVQIEPGQYQPRQDFNEAALTELAQSIASQGLIEPIIVRPIAENRYEIIAGERRWRAAQRAGLTELPCLVGAYSDEQACTLSLIENIQRADLTILEEAQVYQRLVHEFHYRQEEIATLVGKSRSHIANSVRLLGLSDVVKEGIRKQTISFGHARMLVSLEPAQQAYFAQQITSQQWSVRQLEQAVQKQNHTSESTAKNSMRDKDVARLQTLLSEQVGAPVEIDTHAEDAGGWLKVKFFNNDTLAGLLERLGLRYD